jgi:hypothetical protein
MSLVFSSNGQQVLTAEKSRRFFPRNTRNMLVFRDSSHTNRTPENGLLRSGGDHCHGFFSGGHIRSPVSRSTSGECNAIKSWGLGDSELTFAGTAEPH